MDLISRKSVLCTPRQALAEMYMMRGGVAQCPKWFEKRLDAVGEYLSAIDYKGRPILDEPMGMASIDAVLKEAWTAINTEHWRQREFERVVQDAKPH